MITATFIFEQDKIDESYLELDRQISEAARDTRGYLGEEGWTNTGAGLISTVYYWEDEAALRTFMQNECHRQAKARYEQWIRGYRVEIARILRCYGDDRIPSPSTLARHNPAGRRG
jgi:heme-degrading monooxygenase HmoA